jgi:hypothetical protein
MDMPMRTKLVSAGKKDLEFQLLKLMKVYCKIE